MQVRTSTRRISRKQEQEEKNKMLSFVYLYKLTRDIYLCDYLVRLYIDEHVSRTITTLATRFSDLLFFLYSRVLFLFLCVCVCVRVCLFFREKKE